jgi:hypothetical protein
MLRRSAGMLLLLLLATGTCADDDEADVRALIGAWYDELRKGRDGHRWKYLAPSAMLLPRYCPDRCGPQPRALKLDELFRPRYLVELSEKFAFEIERLKIEGTLARVDIWERGWRYAWAAERTTENAAVALFILEKRPGEDWKILVYNSESRALRPQDRDKPMPDLKPKLESGGTPSP